MCMCEEVPDEELREEEKEEVGSLDLWVIWPFVLFRAGGDAGSKGQAKACEAQ